MFFKVLFFLLLTLSLIASDRVQSNYYVDSDAIYLSHVVPHAKEDFKIFSFDRGQYIKRVKAQELLEILKEYGYPTYTAESRYVQFTKKSPIDLSKIELSVREFYEKKYPDIKIKTISVRPRGFIKSLSENYSVKLERDAHLSRDGTLYVKTDDHKKIFFDYDVEAQIDVIVTKKKIKRGEELSLFNATRKSIILERLRAMPLQDLQKISYESKQHLNNGHIVTMRDVKQLSIVKRNTVVSVGLRENNVVISFSAKALQDGKLGDTIMIQKNNLQRLKVVVIGKNRVEIR